MAYEEARKEIVAFVPDTGILSVGVAGTGASAEGVPADHQRFVYFRRYWNLGGESVLTVYESFAGVLVVKDQMRLTANNVWPADDTPYVEPVMSFRASSFIRIQLSGGGGTTSGAGIALLVADKPAGAI